MTKKRKGKTMDTTKKSELLNAGGKKAITVSWAEKQRLFHRRGRWA